VFPIIGVTPHYFVFLSIIRLELTFYPMKSTQSLQRIHVILITFLASRILLCDSLVSNQRKFCNLQLERDLRQKGKDFLIGSDESGVGTIAGPVVAASCCILTKNLDEYRPIEGVKDSKLLTPEERETIYNILTNRTGEYAIHIGLRTNQEIDDTNIFQSTMNSLRESIQGLITTNDLPFEKCYCVVDGKRSPKLDDGFKGVVTCRPYVKADLEVYSVALASIIAKVTCDRIMKMEAHEQYPQYDFMNNLGYSSPKHIELLHKWGPSPLHRLTFKASKGR